MTTRGRQFDRPGGSDDRPQATPPVADGRSVMHIVTAAHDFYPDPGAGGTGRYVYETARRLVARGHRVSVITRRRGDIPRREEIDGIAIYRYDLEIADRPAPTVFSQLLRALPVVADHLAHATADGPPDLVSYQGPVTSYLVGRHVEADIPRITTFHSPWPTEYRIRTRHSRRQPRRWANATIRWGLERELLRQSASVVTLSEYMQSKLERVYDIEPETIVIPGGVDGDRYTPTAGSSQYVLEGQPTFLTVRRLAERMGHDILLDAFATVVDRHPSARLYIAGDGPLRGQLERHSETNDVADRTTFLGYVPDSALPALYASVDLFVLPTTELEGFGLATLESLAAGTPVVGTPVGGTVEVLSDLANSAAIPLPMLAPAATSRALANLMLGWAALPGRTIQAAGRASCRYVCDQFSWDRTVSQLECWYDRYRG